MFEQLLRFLDKYNILKDPQVNFQKKRSTVAAAHMVIFIVNWLG